MPDGVTIGETVVEGEEIETTVEAESMTQVESEATTATASASNEADTSEESASHEADSLDEEVTADDPEVDVSAVIEPDDEIEEEVEA